MCEQEGAVRPPYLKQKPVPADAECMDQPRLGRLNPAVAAAWLSALALLLAAYAAVILIPVGGSHLQDAFGRWVYDAVVLGAAAAVLARAASLPGERLAWLSLGTGLLLWALGQTYYSVALYYTSPAPFPSPSDALFLAFYPATFLALVLLLRSRSARVDSFAWVDGLIGALAVAAVTAALIFPPVLEALGGDTLGVTVSLAYPCADLVLLGLVAGALTDLPLASQQGTWRTDRGRADPLRRRRRRLSLCRRSVDRGAQPCQHRLASRLSPARRRRLAARRRGGAGTEAKCGARSSFRSCSPRPWSASWRSAT